MSIALTMVLLCPTGMAASEAHAQEVESMAASVARAQKVESMANLLIDYVEKRRPPIPAQIDVYVSNADLQGPLHMVVQPALDQYPHASVEIFDVEKGAWEVAAEYVDDGHAEIPLDKAVARYKVDTRTCPQLEPAIAVLSNKLASRMAAFSSAPPKAQVPRIGLSHDRRVEVRIGGMDYEGFSISSQFPGPGDLMTPVDRVAQLAAGCAGESVRRMVFDTESALISN